MEKQSHTYFEKYGFSAKRVGTFRQKNGNRTVHKETENGGIVFDVVYDFVKWKVIVEREDGELEEYTIPLEENIIWDRPYVSPDNQIIGVMAKYTRNDELMLIRRGHGVFMTIRVSKQNRHISVHNNSTCVCTPGGVKIVPYDGSNIIRENYTALACRCLPEWGGVKRDFYAIETESTVDDEDEIDDYEDEPSSIIIMGLGGVVQRTPDFEYYIIDMLPHRGGICIVAQQYLQSTVTLYWIDSTEKDWIVIGSTHQSYDTARDCVFPIGIFTWAHCNGDGQVHFYSKRTLIQSFYLEGAPGHDEQYSFCERNGFVSVCDETTGKIFSLKFAAPEPVVAYITGVLYDSGYYIRNRDDFTNTGQCCKVDNFENLNALKGTRDYEIYRNQVAIEKMAKQNSAPAIRTLILANNRILNEGLPFLPFEILKMVTDQIIAQEVASVPKIRIK